MNRFKSATGFIRGESGVLTVEFVLIVPFLISAYVLAYAYFDAFRTKNSSQKGAYTVSDLISRETTTVNKSYVDGLKKLYDYLADSDPKDSWMRLSSIVYWEEADRYDVQWSYVTAELQKPLISDDLPGMLNRLPTMADGETLILTETGQYFTPVFDWMFQPVTFLQFIPNSPRFAPQVTWNNG